VWCGFANEALERLSGRTSATRQAQPRNVVYGCETMQNDMNILSASNLQVKCYTVRGRLVKFGQRYDITCAFSRTGFARLVELDSGTSGKA